MRRCSACFLMVWTVASLAVAGCDDADSPLDAGMRDLAGGAADLAPSGDLSAAGGDMAAPMQGPAPFIVDEKFAASGYEGGGDVPGTITDDASCPARAGDGLGKCHHIVWTPGTHSWGGVVWQSPAGNWGSQPGFAIPAGYGQIRFWAWGKDGGEAISFVAGLGTGSPDGFQTRLDVRLATQPTRYTLGVRGAYGDKVVSAFGWVTSAAQAATFYVDDIEWVPPPDDSDPNAPASFAVEPKFGPSGYIGDGTLGFVTASSCTHPPGAAPGCRGFVWDPSSDAGGVTQGWAGVFWQSAPGNWAGASDPDGAAVAAGYREIRFNAWSDGSVGATASFLAGMGAGTRDGWQSKLDVRLADKPTTYALGVGGGYGANVVGGFGWVAGGSGIRLNIDGATWR
jgi:hypothetical protein